MTSWLARAEQKLANHAMKVAILLIVLLMVMVRTVFREQEKVSQQCYQSVCPEGMAPVLMSENTSARQCVCIPGAKPVQK